MLIADYPVLANKSQADSIAMTMFRESDKITEVRPKAARNSIQWGHVEWDPTETETAVEYRTTVFAAKDRLRVMGFTLEHAERDFLSQKAAYLDSLREMSEGISDLWNDEINLLTGASFRDFLAAIGEIVSSGVHHVYFAERFPKSSALARYLVDDHEEFYWGFPCTDLRCFFRAVLEVVPETAAVTQEITDLVEGAYYAIDDRVSELALQELKGSYSINSPIIVLTEGPTDTQAIQAALHLLYPHLVGYYAFMDLTVRTPGGVGSLVHVVKSFVGAGIENRVVALFDNDAAGRAAMASLGKVHLPSTVRVLHYPDLELTRRYPTIGPTGDSTQDINGCACSIELYFGRDVIGSDRELAPVHWKGYENRVGRYQGEIQGKAILKERFLAKIARARADPSSVSDQGLGAHAPLLDALFDACKEDLSN